MKYAHLVIASAALFLVTVPNSARIQMKYGIAIMVKSFTKVIEVKQLFGLIQQAPFLLKGWQEFLAIVEFITVTGLGNLMLNAIQLEKMLLVN
ncbi:hypothetical protein NIES4071_105040 (plasmid) [Calothrix sp. NIES-4071]|nr:hypothetical protein NIES4071_105040 [Calothrix sp. NIES-4071]BAZ64922.1 hypothetical protein NIES4105_106550 [Calothrix sp. NIES-4105]